MVGGLREFEVPSSGRLVQGGADAVRCFYKEPGAIIVNCARRTGSASVEVRGDVEIYWLPMTEANMQEACSGYLKDYGQTLLAPGTAEGEESFEAETRPRVEGLGACITANNQELHGQEN